MQLANFKKRVVKRAWGGGKTGRVIFRKPESQIKRKWHNHSDEGIQQEYNVNESNGGTRQQVQDLGTIVANEYDDDWQRTCVVAIVKEDINIGSIKNAMYSDGVRSIKVGRVLYQIWCAELGLFKCSDKCDGEGCEHTSKGKTLGESSKRLDKEAKEGDKSPHGEEAGQEPKKQAQVENGEADLEDVDLVSRVEESVRGANSKNSNCDTLEERAVGVGGSDADVRKVLELESQKVAKEGGPSGFTKEGEQIQTEKL
ncbi:hypothetical protein U1Q18_005052 [Sarracenia purpurea var. burkii]